MKRSSGDGGMSPGGRVGARDGGMRPEGPGGGGGLPIDGALEGPSTPNDDQLSQAEVTGKLPLILGAAWRPGHWDPTLRAMPILAAFARSGWEKVALSPPDNSQKALEQDIAALLNLVYMREDRMDELVAQSGEPARYWAQLFSMTPQSHPATWTLMSAAMAVAHMVCMHWKSVYNRPRPPQVYPALMPPIPVPPHPSYPSGHALHAHLIGLTLAEACPAMAPACRTLAQRLAVNRHIAGVHFPSDSEASERLVHGVQGKGPSIWRRLRPVLDSEIWAGEPTPLAAAQAEWGGVSAGPAPKPPAGG